MPNSRYTSSSWQSPPMGEGQGEQGKKKIKKEKEKATTEEPYGIDIRQGAHILNHFFREEKELAPILSKRNYSKSI